MFGIVASFCWRFNYLWLAHQYTGSRLVCKQTFFLSNPDTDGVVVFTFRTSLSLFVFRKKDGCQHYCFYCDCNYDNRICDVCISVELKVDQLPNYLFPHFGPNSDHISPNSSVGFVFAGIALLLLVNWGQLQNRATIIGSVGSGLVAIGGIAVVGYLLDLDIAYGWFGDAKMSMLSAVLFLLIGLSIMVVAWQMLVTNGNENSLALFAIPLCICLLAITLSIWLAIKSEQVLYIRGLELTEIINIDDDFDDAVYRSILTNETFAAVLGEQTNMPQQVWDGIANVYLTQKTPLQKIEHIDEDGKVLWEKVGISLSDNVLAFANKAELSEIMQTAKLEKRTNVGGLKNANDILQGYVVYSPILKDDNIKGFVVTYYDIIKTFHSILDGESSANFFIGFFSGQNLIYVNSDQIQEEEEETINEYNAQTFINSTERLITYYSVQFDIKAKAKPNAIQPPMKSLPWIVLVEGLLATFLISGIVYYAEAARQRTKSLSQTISQLHQIQNCLINQEKLASLGALIAGIAHEVKNPLNYIQNFSELSIGLSQEIRQMVEKITGVAKPEEKKELQNDFKTLEANLKCINEQGQRAGHTIQRMLAHSRARTDEAIDTDLHSLLDEYLKLSIKAYVRRIRTSM